MPKDLSGYDGRTGLDACSRTHQQALERLLEMYEQYRKTVAYELHDGVVQCLTGALMNLEGALHIVGDEVPVAAKAGFQRTLQYLHDGIAEARALMNSLRPALLDDLGLIAALDRFVFESRKKTHATIEWSHDGDFTRLAPPLENALFRMVQEGLGNALRHSGSDRVRVTLDSDSERVCLTVEDWGRGFDPRNVCKSRFGLYGIGERARLLGGKAIIDSTPGSGTRITVELPPVRVPRSEACTDADE